MIPYANANRDVLTAREITDLFKAELEHELGLALAGYYDDAPDHDGLQRGSRLYAEAYRLAQRPNREADLSPEERERLQAEGWSERDIATMILLLRCSCHGSYISDGLIKSRLRHFGIDADPNMVRDARQHMLRARAAAQPRAGMFLDTSIQSAVDPVAALLDTPNTLPRLPTLPCEKAPADDCPFLINDRRRFSELVDETVDSIRGERGWKGMCVQQRRIARTFAWITGDKPLGDYNHMAVHTFKQGLKQLPKDIRFGSFGKGVMSTPFAEFMKDPANLGGGEPRTKETINRDLSTMSTIAKELAKTVWAPRMHNIKVLDFTGAMIAESRRTEEEDKRPPWTREHVSKMFASRIYTGSGGPKNRLKESDAPQVWHDAAYWNPLIWYYTGSCREELCGVRADEVNIDHDVPHFLIQDNDVRGDDGEKAGEKRIVRKRTLPLHPELIRLGILDYVRAIRAEGHVDLYPELYVNKVKRGGAHFYDVAWTHIVNELAMSMEIPMTPNRKEADVASIRTLSGSFYEIEGVNENIRADVMGHARSGTNGKHYSKRMLSEGLGTVIRERLEFMVKYIPVITSDLQTFPTRLLHLESRSRVGSGRPRKIHADKGTSRI